MQLDQGAGRTADGARLDDDQVRVFTDHLGERDVDQPRANQVDVGRPWPETAQLVNQFDARAEVAEHRVAEAQDQRFPRSVDRRVHDLERRSMQVGRPMRKDR